MKISAAGIKAIEQREGNRNKAYADSRGIPTVGVGHTGPEVHLGLVWTDAQVDSALTYDLTWAIEAVNDSVKVQLTQNEFDACVSVCFNIGAAGFKGSSIVRMLNDNRPLVAADDFMMWDKPIELLKRRRSEQAQFLSRNEPQVGGNAAPGNPTVTPTPPITPPILPQLTTFAGVKDALTLLGFGTVYAAAVKSFQTWAGLKADGIVGPKTQVALKAALAKLSKPGVTK